MLNNMDEYQELAQRTSGTDNPGDKLVNGVLGLCGEVGEIADILKKCRYHGHPYDPDHLIRELGDVYWYLAEATTALGLKLSDIATVNIEKLMRRYPHGFSSERSQHREEGDV